MKVLKSLIINAEILFVKFIKLIILLYAVYAIEDISLVNQEITAKLESAAGLQAIIIVQHVSLVIT